MPSYLDLIRPAVWRAFDAVYALVNYAHQEESAVPELLDVDEFRYLFGPLAAQVKATAARLLDDFVAAAAGLPVLADRAVLDRLVAAFPQTVQAPGIRSAACPVAAVAEYTLAVLQILNVTFGQERLNLSQGVLQDTDRRRLLTSWPYVRARLQQLHLPDQDLLRVGLEQNFAIAAAKESEKKRSGDSTLDQLQLPGLVSARDLAGYYKLPYKSVLKRLKEWRDDNPKQERFGWFKSPDPKRSDPKHLYKHDAVQGIMEEMARRNER